MNRAIADTNVVQNVALSPSTWLIPSSLIILKMKITGYNNQLKTATESMSFGLNSSVNYDSSVDDRSPQHKGTHNINKTSVKKILGSEDGTHLPTLNVDDHIPKTTTTGPLVEPHLSSDSNVGTNGGTPKAIATAGNLTNLLGVTVAIGAVVSKFV